MERAWSLHKNVYTVPVSYSENRHRFFTPCPASNVTSVERQTIHCGLGSFDPPVIMTASGTTQATAETTVYVCNLAMVVQIQ